MAGILVRSADGLLKEKIDVKEGKIFRAVSARWEFDLIRLGTRQTTAVVRINGDTTNVEPDSGCVGILHKHNGLQITLHVDQLRLTEEPR